MSQKKKKHYPITESALSFELKAPLWATYTCAIATAVGLLGTLIFLALKSSLSITPQTFEFIYLFLLVLVLGGVGLYACLYEKFILQDGVYTYYKPFLKNQSAQATDIAYVEMITSVSMGTRGYREIYFVKFYGHDGKILIKFMDDGTFFKNPILVKSLRSQGVKVRHVKKES